MVETPLSFMQVLLPLSPRATAPTPHALPSTNSSSSFGSCKQAWYYRCLGLDP
ncbi:hypothetical protein I3843_03G066200 [Carya illinoinensis]|uniref:Uncharacterized protein n=1 Tax=Carya illinoinensis TaxID=32201 RepID=A0A922FHX8_CARIL|nr:hypothetical protein I3760_03G063200 [Carya illinoinensis]KAG6720498.1 hypothetical protein I3842_03G065700 [Carya illinoinensis]KAG7986135.1 hypothetical protein I3843_03G066200 [Carya illinoinensis]